MPEVEYDICPSFALASAINSFSDLTGSEGCTTRMVGSAEINASGINWSSVYAGLRSKSLSAYGITEMLDSAINSV